MGDLAAPGIIVGDERLVLVFTLEGDAAKMFGCRLHGLVGGVGLHGRNLGLQLVLDLLRQLLVGNGLKMRGRGLASSRQRSRLRSLARNGHGSCKGAVDGSRVSGGRHAGLTLSRDGAL